MANNFKKIRALKIALFPIFIFIILWLVHALYHDIYISDPIFTQYEDTNLTMKEELFRILYILHFTIIIGLLPLFIIHKVKIKRKEKSSYYRENLVQKLNKLDKVNQLFNSLKDPLLALRSDYVCILANQTFLGLFDLRTNTVENRTVDEIIHNRELLIKIKHGLLIAAEHGIYKTEISIQGEDSISEYSISLFMSPGLSENHKSYILTFHDVTLQKKQDRINNLKKQQIEKHHSTNRLVTLSAGISHEINNPNSAIMLNASLLKRTFSDIQSYLNKQDLSKEVFGGFSGDKISEKTTLMLEGILSGSKGIVNITDELRDYARKDSGIYEKVDINEILKTSLEKIKYLQEKHSVSINVELKKSRPIYTRGIYQKVEQLFTNLLINAIESLNNEGNSIEIISRTDPRTRNIEVLIIDSGIGMSEETLLHIRDPFYTTKRNTGSIGLGLSISSRIIEDHEGTLDFISMEDSGTTAIVHLPLWEDLVH